MEKKCQSGKLWNKRFVPKENISFCIPFGHICTGWGNQNTHISFCCVPSREREQNKVGSGQCGPILYLVMDKDYGYGVRKTRG